VNQLTACADTLHCFAKKTHNNNNNNNNNENKNTSDNVCGAVIMTKLLKEFYP